jgi:Domain of unknown function (DUF4263)
MTKTNLRPTSKHSAICDPIVLREGERVRLVFVPSLVDNPAHPKASVDGHFVYQRKAASGNWLPVPTQSLSRLREGDEFKLTLHAEELRRLVDSLVPLFLFYERRGSIPARRRTLIEVDDHVADLIERSGTELTQIDALQRDDSGAVAAGLAPLLSWLSSFPNRAEAAAILTRLKPGELPSLSAAIGLASLKSALEVWKHNRTNKDEEFWQECLAERAFVISQVFAYPIIIINAKAYVGGKQVTNRFGHHVDFLAKVEKTSAAVLLEIKTPQTRLLAYEYRAGVFPLSSELSAAISQALTYAQSFARNIDSLTSADPGSLSLGAPPTIVLAGNTSELDSPSKRESFELMRERINGVTVLAYDELFGRTEQLINLLETGEA